MSKEMRAERSGQMTVSPGVVAATAAVVETADLQDYPDMDLDTLGTSTTLLFSAGGFDHLIHIGSISKAQPQDGGAPDGDYSADVHIKSVSGDVLTIRTNGTMEYEGRLVDPAASGRRLSETSGHGSLQLSSGDGGLKCKLYCVKNKKFTWAEKCGEGKNYVVKKCSGCLQCADTTYTGLCAKDCAGIDQAWKSKCKCQHCSACDECGGDDGGSEADGPSTTAQPPGPSIGSFTVAAGSPFTATLSAPAALDAPVRVDLERPPAGLSVNERSGKLTWQPDPSQVGEYVVGVVFTSASNEVDRRSVALSVSAGAANPAGLYVWPMGGSDGNEGSASSPFASLEHAARQARPGDTIFVRGGRCAAKFEIDVRASATNPVVITRLPGERVRFHPYTGKNAFTVLPSAEGVTFRGFEIYGSAEQDDHWKILRETWWQMQDTRAGGHMAFDIDGQHILVEECIIHDLAQKGVNVQHARYVIVRNNVIYNIGHTSITGGHGIMRQWPKTFGNDDDPDYYRWGFYGNLIFAVEQRIYSFTPKKEYCQMLIDEGKGILIDETRDKVMKARIAHNVVLYGGVDQIRLKTNPNMEVTNNAVLSEQGRTSPIVDGITAVKKPLIPGLVFRDNLVQTFPESFSIDVAEHFPDAASRERCTNNYYGGGGRVRESLPGITDLGEVQVFRDPSSLDFRPSQEVPAGVGVAEEVLAKLRSLMEDSSIDVRASGWRHDHVRMTETIVDSAPRGHVELRGEGKSKHESDKQALWFDVISDEYKAICGCKELELIPPQEYWDAN